MGKFVTIWELNCEPTANRVNPAWRATSLEDRVEKVSRLAAFAHGKAQALRPEKLDFHLFCAPEFLFADHELPGEAREKPVSLYAYAETRANTIVQRLSRITVEHENLLLIPGTLFWRHCFQGDSEQARVALETDRFGLSRIPATATLETDLNVVDMQRTVAGNRVRHRTGLLGELREDDRRASAFFEDEADSFKLVHNISFVHNTAYAFWGEELLSYSKTSPDESEFSSPQAVFISGDNLPGNTPLFEFGGTKIGIEICADHANGVLVSRATARDRDLHLILSGYISERFFGDQTVVPQGGVVVSADTRGGGTLSRRAEGGVFDRIEPSQSFRLNGELGRLKIFEI